MKYEQREEAFKVNLMKGRELIKTYQKAAKNNRYWSSSLLDIILSHEFEIEKTYLSCHLNPDQQELVSQVLNLLELDNETPPFLEDFPRGAIIANIEGSMIVIECAQSEIVIN